MNNQARLSIKFLIIAIIVALVVGIVIIAAYKMDLPDWVRNLPGFNNSQIRTDLIVQADIGGYYDSPVQVLLDDGEGRCVVIGYVDENKKIGTTGYYGLEKRKLIYNHNLEDSWGDIDDESATDWQIFYSSLRESLMDSLLSLEPITSLNIDPGSIYYDKERFYAEENKPDKNLEQIQLSFDKSIPKHILLVAPMSWGKKYAINEFGTPYYYDSSWKEFEQPEYDYLYQSSWKGLDTKRKIKDNLLNVCVKRI